eukprot:jgi/Botrbrau1/1186/Bobra.0162s0067.1
MMQGILSIGQWSAEVHIAEQMVERHVCEVVHIPGQERYWKLQVRIRRGMCVEGMTYFWNVGFGDDPAEPSHVCARAPPVTVQRSGGCIDMLYISCCTNEFRCNLCSWLKTAVGFWRCAKVVRTSKSSFAAVATDRSRLVVGTHECNKFLIRNLLRTNWEMTATMLWVVGCLDMGCPPPEVPNQEETSKRSRTDANV